MEFLIFTISVSVVIGLWSLITYPHLAIALLLITPLVKAAAITYVPFFRSVDLTVIVNLLAGISGLWVYIRQRSQHFQLFIPYHMLLCLGIVFLVFLTGLLWTTAPNYGHQKVVRFIGIGLPYMVLPAFFVRSKQDGIRVLHIIIVISVLVALLLIAFPESHLSIARYGRFFGRGTFFGSDPNSPASIIVVGILLLVITVFAGVASRWLKYSAFLLIPLGLTAILITGSRANLLGLFSILPFMALFINRHSRGKWILFGFIFVSLLIFMSFMLSTMFEHIPVDRWLKFTKQVQSGDLSSNRLPAWSFCARNAWDHLIIFGHGPGSYAKDFLKEDLPLWPHNILMEALYEAGIVGFMALFSYFVVCARTILKGLRASHSSEDLLLVAGPSAIVLSMTMMAMTHWDIDGSRFLYLFSGILHVNVEHILRQEISNLSGVT